MLQKINTNNQITLMEAASFLCFLLKKHKKIEQTAGIRTTKMPVVLFQKHL
jgi:hypothetical protein